MKTARTQTSILLAATLSTCAFAAQAKDQFMVVPGPADVKWGDAGPQFPNTQFALITGDPEKKEPVTFRFRCPANYKFMPHTNPGVERVTVLTGTMLIGVGAKYDAAQLKETQTGGHFVIPAREPHYGECKDKTIIEVHTNGPLGTKFVNPADDATIKK